MIVKKVHIEKFRGFKNVSFLMGRNITVIAGQNGTQKTTLLGILSQPFALTGDNPMSQEKPLCGGNYRSNFSEKFKLSPEFDKSGEHEWTLTLFNKEEFSVKSIPRDDKTIRFWKKNDKTKGAGYLQYPVIYLSLARLFPLGESREVEEEVSLTGEELTFYKEWHDRILCIPTESITSAALLSGNTKKTVGVNTDSYDWRMNSAGQDNLGKILLAILSFKRLQEHEQFGYQAGILVIDELDATLFPASQEKLFDALMHFSEKYRIQVIFTTHSLFLLKKASELSSNEHRRGQCRLLLNRREDDCIFVDEKNDYGDIEASLKVSLRTTGFKAKIPIIMEDAEARVYFRAIIKRMFSNRVFLYESNLSCDSLVNLVRSKIPGFRKGESIVILDGDYNKQLKEKNILLLPGKKSPERMVADFLHDLPDSDKFWGEVGSNFTKQVAFRDISYKEISNNREKAKQWFNAHKNLWGRNCSKVFSRITSLHNHEVLKFKDDLSKLVQRMMQK